MCISWASLENLGLKLNEPERELVSPSYQLRCIPTARSAHEINFFRNKPRGCYVRLYIQQHASARFPCPQHKPAARGPQNPFNQVYTAFRKRSVWTLSPAERHKVARRGALLSSAYR